MLKKYLFLQAVALLVLTGCRQSASPVTPSATAVDFSSSSHDWKDHPEVRKAAQNRDLLPVVVGKKWGYIGKDGAIKITPQYDKAYDFVYNLAEVCVGECTYDKPGKHGVLMTNGQFLVNPTYDDIGGVYSELISVCIGKCGWSGEESKWGFVDRKGTVVIQPQFGKVRNFLDGIAAVCVGTKCGGLEPNGKWGYIDKTGRFLINPQFDEAGDFEDGIAQVTVGTGNDAKIGYIDSTGKMIYNPTN